MSFNRPSLPLQGQSIAVLGAGIVGVSVAWALLDRGAEVTLMDKEPPGQGTSYGNAGVIARSSLIPLNAPWLWADLPAMLPNQSTALRYQWPYLWAKRRWLAQFLRHARPTPFGQTTAALDGLLRSSIDIHKRLIATCALDSLAHDTGWLHLFRTAKGFAQSAAERAKMADYGVDFVTLEAEALRALEPSLAPVFAHATWVRGGLNIRNPAALVAGYARGFVARGGRIDRCMITDIEPREGGLGLRTSDGRIRAFDQAVLALGPWTPAVLARMGYHTEMAVERGYHRHFRGAALTRPLHDVQAGYVLAPMQQGLRLTSGVELAAPDAPPDYRQIERAEQAARSAIDLGERLEETPWLGCRPTLPDSRPAIGAVPGAARLWACFGHQHIGLASGPGSGALLAQLMAGEPPSIPAAPFEPARFIQSRHGR